jgi:hypothetical protein
MIKFSKSEKESINRLHLITGKPLHEVREFYEGLLIDFMISYMDKSPVKIPLFGEIIFKYLGDEVTKKGRRAKIDIDFIPDSFLLRTIGQIEDGDESDLEIHLREKIRKSITSSLED